MVASIAEKWPFEPVVAAACLLALALFVQGFVRLRRRGRRDHAGRGRAVLFVTAVSLTYLALASPISAVGEDRLLAAHMLEHLLFADLAIALGMLAVRGPLVLFLLPPSILGPLARSPGLRRFLHRLTGPWVALAIWSTRRSSSAASSSGTCSSTPLGESGSRSRAALPSPSPFSSSATS